jgi:hypothetical protein
MKKYWHIDALRRGCKNVLEHITAQELEAALRNKTIVFYEGRYWAEPPLRASKCIHKDKPPLRWHNKASWALPSYVPTSAELQAVDRD